MALTKPWSSSLLPRPQPPGARPGTFFRGCDVLQRRELLISLHLVHVLALSSSLPGAAFAGLGQMQHSPNDDLFLGYLSLDTRRLVSLL